MYGSDHDCPLCGTKARLAPLSGDYSDIKCERCGRFRITGTAEAVHKDSDLRRRLSGWVRDQNRTGVDLPVIESYTNPPNPSPSDRVAKLLLEAMHGLEKPEQHISLGEPRFIAASYSSDHDEVIYLWQEMVKRGWSEKVFDQGPRIRITVAGHDAATRLPEEVRNRPISDTISSLAPHPVGAVANFVIGRTQSYGIPITHLKLQKLVYISYGVYLAMTKGARPLFRERIEAWPYGPVIPELYHEFKRFGRSRIKRWSSNFDYEANRRVWPVVSKDDALSVTVLNFTWSFYGSKKATALAQLTHQKGTPWDQTKPGEIINDDLIRDHFLWLIHDELSRFSSSTDTVSAATPA